MKQYHVEIRICDPDAPKDWWYINSFYVDANNMEEAAKKTALTEHLGNGSLGL